MFYSGKVIADSTAQAIVQTAIATGLPTPAVLTGVLIHNSRLSDLRAHMDSRFGMSDTGFTQMEAMWRAELRRVEEVMDARLKHLEERR